MKMKIYITAYLTAGLLIAVCATPLHGQAYSATPAAHELIKYKSLWMQSHNAAGSYLDRAPEFASVSVGYHWLSGDFRMPQQGEKQTGLALNAEGSSLLDNFYAWGTFAYRRDVVKDVLYNSSIIDPYRGMPYYVIDEVPSEWRNQDYDMTFRLTSRRLWNFLHVGVEGSYRAQFGAKQLDYRTENKAMFIEVRPGIVISPDSWKGNSLGLNFEYFNFKEEGVMDRDNLDNPMHYFENWGLGMGTDKGATSQRYVDYTADSFGGALQYSFATRCGGILLECSYRVKVEDERTGSDNTNKPASVKDGIWEAKALFYQRTSSLTHNVVLSASDHKIDGIEYLIKDQTADEPAKVVMGQIKSKYHTQNAALAYRLICERGAEYNWLAEIGADYTCVDNEYLLPASTQEYENLSFHAGFRKNFKLSESFTDPRLLLSGKFAYKLNLDGKYDFNGYFPDYPTVKLENANMAYLMSDYYAFDISIAYSRKIRQDSRANLFIKGSFSMANTSDYDFSKRQSVKVALGCNF